MGDRDYEEADQEDNSEPEINQEKETGCFRKFQNLIIPPEFRDRYMQRANCRPPPIFIIGISIAELAVFIYYALWKPHKQWVTLDEGIWKSPLTYDPAKRQEAWRFLSYMFMHAGVGHIFGNLVMQLLLGIPLEMVHKGHEVGLVYLAGVLAGSLASSIFDPLTVLVGASGGVYALYGGYFINAVVNFKQMKLIFGVTRILIIVLIVVADFGYALYRRFANLEGGVKVSFVAHLGGIVAGLTIGYVFFIKFNTKLCKNPLFWICILGYAVFLIFAVFFNIFISPAS
ncbi:rhomboid-related protein 2 [Poecilia formosa]|nr:PREDICTED: rhomboid-related protein 2 [Poecilia formosa]